MKIEQALEFNELYERLKDTKMPIKTAYKLNKIYAMMEKEIEFYRKGYLDILQRYGQRNEDGTFEMSEDQTGVKIIDGQEEACARDIRELGSIDIILEQDITLSLEELESLEVSVNEMKNLMPFLGD